MRRSFTASAVCTASIVAQAAPVYISGDITTSTNLPKLAEGDFYSLTNQVYVLPGAALTIEAGALFKSDGGGLAVSRGAQIFVQGTRNEPVIMTSIHDDLATWREAANEWGNLTICGNALISASRFKGRPVINSGGTANHSQPDGRSNRNMEGLTAAFEGDTRHFYGGNNDADDSGTLNYLSIRYGGKVSGLGDELNGLSLGGVGQGTDIDYVEIMNNTDDGIEIWGGKVNLKHVSIWNVGDDSLDIDQGWRGQAQFGLIVQGYSRNAGQGSGVGDNCIEHDGAETSDAQPVTTAEIYNFTVIGQPFPGAGDGGTAWRDNARVQYRNCIWMDLGDQLIHPDGDDGDGAGGYGFNGTLTFSQTWATAYTELPTNSVHVSPYTLYTAQSEGHLAEITHSIFYRNPQATYTEATNRNVFAASNNNLIAGLPDQPIVKIVREPPVIRGGKVMLRVTSLDPCAARDAVTSAKIAPDNGFYCKAPYVGAFSSDNNWLLDWTAADQFGMVDDSSHSAPTATIAKGGVSISFQSQDGIWYVVQSAADAGFTSPVDEVNILGNGHTMSYVDEALDANRFFRVVYK